MSQRNKKLFSIDLPDQGETVLKIRRQLPPPGRVHKDRKKAANKKKCRKKVVWG